ncbi:MAG: SdpI family protein [Oscillospiraceae bacterium]|nr:SdpI family protein [Oscillospiraceae bacterium]
MDFITSLFDMDFAALVPELEALLGSLRPALTVALLAGPIVLLALGLLYLFLSPPEANYRFGFRTYFGMGSVEAWRFSQKIAGIAYGGVGLVLLIVMIVTATGFGGKDAFQMAETAIICLLWQVGAVLFAQLAVAILAGVFFRADGSRRRE